MLVTQNQKYLSLYKYKNSFRTMEKRDLYRAILADIHLYISRQYLLMAVESLKHFTCYFVCLFISFYFTFIQQLTAKFTNPSACELRKSRGNSIRRHFVGLRKRERKGIVDTVKSEWNQARKTLIYIK